MDSIQKEQILNEYCGNEMQKLKQMCYPKISKIGGISQMDHDDLYSIALDVLRYSVERYDDSQDCKFSTYLSGNIDRKFSTYVRDRLREKRSGEVQYDEDGNRVFSQSISLDMKIEDDIEWSEKVESDFNLDNEISEEFGLHSDNEEEWHQEVKDYLNSLSPLQKQIIHLLSINFTPEEICEELHITKKHYNNSFNRMTSSDKIKPMEDMIERMNRSCSC